MAASFWASLWPELVATFVGVAAGLPIALWLNRLATRATRRAEEQRRRQALSRATRALRWSVTWNGEKAGQLAALLDDGAVPWDTPFEVARWEAVRDEFIRNADDPDLQSRVAFFFSDVRLNAERTGHLFDFVFGPSAGTARANEVNAAVRDQLLESLPGLESEARELDRLLSELEAAGDLS